MNALRRLRIRNGAASIEMAMVAPFVLLLIFGAIEFSRMMMVRQAFTNAARTGCRQACLVTTRNQDEVKTFTREILSSVVSDNMNEDVIRISIDPPFTTPLDRDTKIKMSVEVNCEDVSFLPEFLFQGIRIRAYSTMIRD